MNIEDCYLYMSPRERFYHYIRESVDQVYSRKLSTVQTKHYVDQIYRNLGHMRYLMQRLDQEHSPMLTPENVYKAFESMFKDGMSAIHIKHKDDKIQVDVIENKDIIKQPEVKPVGSFEDKAKNVSIDGVSMVGTWTDGVGVYADNEDPCAFKMEAGKRYRVTVEEIVDDTESN